MKRIIKTLTLLICLYVAVISCGKDNSVKSSGSIVGTWKYSEDELLFNGKSTSHTEIYKDDLDWMITFTEDGVMIDNGHTSNYIYSPESNTLTDIYYEGGIEDRDSYYLKVLSPSEFVMSYGLCEHDISEFDQNNYVGTYKGTKIYRYYDDDDDDDYYYYRKDGKLFCCDPIGNYDDSYKGQREYYDEELMHFKRID